MFFVALTAVIGAGLYLNQRHAPAPESPGGANLPQVIAPASHVPRQVVPVAHSETEERTNRLGVPMPPTEKVEEYLARHNRNAASLLAAFHALSDTNYLNEAATNFPNDPRVQLAVLARNAFPEDRRKWLESFKTSSPSNSLANYLSAQDYFKNHQPDAAMKEISAASGKSQFKEYSMETILDGEDLGRFSGSSAMETREASMAAMSEDLLPQLANFKAVALGIKDMQQQYASAGDSASVQTLAQTGIDFANRISTGDSGKILISQLVGMAVEAIATQSLDQNTPYDFLGGETPAQRLAEKKQQRVSIRELSQNLSSVLPTMSEDQMASYWERQKIYGELEAMRWLVQQSAATPNSGN